MRIESDVVASSSDTSDLVYFPYERVVPGGGPNGETCIVRGTIGVRPGEDTGLLSNATSYNLPALYPACPAQPADESEAQTPESYAVEFWNDVSVPGPDPYIAPGRAITGMFAYLETRGTTTHTYTESNTPFGLLTVVATGRYYVDWGDGTTTGPHSAEGGPWPDGKIKHEYIHVGAYDVVVTERWTATWSFGDQSGTLSELRSVGRIDDFPVQQIQAVVLR
ncbi:MAG: hypothetical protein QOG82_481 [Actinomycetota bacterium]|jgi:hypothetical protein|nr:hypothetical protein [Actinomycetota bacterium]